MACCILIVGLLALVTWPLHKLGIIKPKVSALTWQPAVSGLEELGPRHDMKLSGKRFSLNSRVKSFRYAFAGLGYVIKNEHNARIHLLASMVVILTAIYLQVSSRDFALLIFVIMSVFFAETINTAFEHLCDVVSPEKNESVKFTKDIAAGAVLICTFGACLIGLIIFLPYVMGSSSSYDILCRS